MARKKSATKKAKEAALKEEVAKEEAPIIEKSRSESELSEGSESSSEEEDDFGELITGDVEEGIQKVLTAIRTKDQSLFDANVKFFNEAENEAELKKDPRYKPIYLKDYQRMKLLSGNHNDDEEEKPFVETQRDERNQILSEINQAVGEESDDEQDLFTKKNRTEIERKLLPDPDKNQDQFLNEFVGSQAWIPAKGDTIINLDGKGDRIQEDDEEFEEAAEKFEKAYNFRFEDPNGAEIVSYARNQATIRRSDASGRRKVREKKQEEAKEEARQKEEAVSKKKTKKINMVMDRLASIKEAVGKDVDDQVIKRVFGETLMKDDFEDADWDAKMSEIFNEQYYGGEIEKPQWDEDDEIMQEFEEEQKSKKDKKKEKKSKKKEKSSLKETAEKMVADNALSLVDEVDEERGRKKDRGSAFKYREVSPETFGLTTREILLADDKDLNEFIGVKKFAPYRSKEARTKDKRKYAKKKRLREWRKQVFNDEDGPQEKKVKVE